MYLYIFATNISLAGFLAKSCKSKPLSFLFFSFFFHGPGLNGITLHLVISASHHKSTGIQRLGMYECAIGMDASELTTQDPSSVITLIICDIRYVLFVLI